jgi:hypothetical protein
VSLKTRYGGSVQQRLILEAAKYNFTYATRNDRAAWYVNCSVCNAESVVGAPNNAPPQLIATHFSKRGWNVGFKQPPICPDCQKANRMTKTLSIPTPTPTPQTAPDPKIARKVYAALDERFNETTRTYAAGWSDERVAKELSVALPLVVGIRTSAYGELAEDPRITKLREDVEFLRMEFEEEMTKLTAKYANRVKELQELIYSLLRHPKAGG